MSPPLTFSMKWTKTCFFCGNPLEPFLKIYQHNNDLLKKIVQFSLLRPLPIERNISFLKVMDLKCREVCMCCFQNRPHVVSPQTIRTREITGKTKQPKCLSLTKKDICDWHDALRRFVNRPDAEDYFVGAPN